MKWLDSELSPEDWPHVESPPLHSPRRPVLGVDADVLDAVAVDLDDWR